MDWDFLKQIIIQKCQQTHKTQAYTQKFLHYAQNLHNQQLPIISSPLHLSMLIGMDHKYVCSMAAAPAKFYRHFSILKSNGKTRPISEPLPDLKYVQHWILKNILEKCAVSIYAKAYVKNQTIKANAKFHRAQKLVVTLDIKDFFPSISFYMVRNVFIKMGYLKTVSNFIANLCCYNSCLPQGAPTSPYISNLCMKSFDDEISKYIKEKKIRYTRYADDLTFSGDFNPHILIHDIGNILYSHGFHMNPDKTRVAYQNTRQEVTGIVVNSHMQIERKKRKDIRQQMYYIKKYGLNSHLNHIQETRSHYINHLLGQVNHSIFINPNDKEMKEYYTYLVDLLKHQANG